MRYFSKEVLFATGEAPLRKVFRVEAASAEEATELLDMMVKLYTKQLEGKKPIDDIGRMKSIPKETSEVSERTVQMLTKIFKQKKN